MLACSLPNIFLLHHDPVGEKIFQSMLMACSAVFIFESGLQPRPTQPRLLSAAAGSPSSVLCGPL